MIRQSSRVLTIGPDPKAKGGMASVIAYLSRMFEPFNLIITYKETSKIGKLFLFIRAVLKTAYYCMFKRIEIVHIHTSNYMDFFRNSILLCLCKLFGKKVLLHIHGSKFDGFYRAYTRYVTFVCRRSDALITVSSDFVKMLRQYDLNKHIYRLPNCVDFPERFREEQNHDKLHLVFVGRVDEVKGIYDVLECLYKYKEKLRDKVEFHIGGQGDEQRFQKVIKDYGLSTMVIQHGWLDKEKKEELLCSSDVFIHPSHFESFGIAILEAMSYGLPVITTLVGGIPDFFKENESGVAVASGNVDEIYAAICLFINDRSLISRLGNRGREVARQFSPLQIELRLQGIYSNLSPI